MRAFQGVAKDNFEERGVGHLRRCLPEATAAYSDAQLKQHIDRCIGRAGRYGLTTERQVMGFVDATYLAGEHFDADPACGWAPRLLESDKMPGDDRASLLVVFAEIERRKRS